MDRSEKLGLLGAAIAAGVAALAAGGGAARILAGPKQQGLALALAQKWGPVFGAPVPLIMTIMDIESSFRPGVKNTNARAMKLGGAWGLMAMTLSTAKSIAAQLRGHANPLVVSTLSRWDGTGPGLLNPDINVMMGAHELGRDYAEFRDPYLTAGAYHQGRGKIRELVKAGKPIPASLPPFGRQYVTDAIRKFPRYA